MLLFDADEDGGNLIVSACPMFEFVFGVEEGDCAYPFIDGRYNRFAVRADEVCIITVGICHLTFLESGFFPTVIFVKAMFGAAGIGFSGDYAK